MSTITEKLVYDALPADDWATGDRLMAGDLGQRIGRRAMVLTISDLVRKGRAQRRVLHGRTEYRAVPAPAGQDQATAATCRVRRPHEPHGGCPGSAPEFSSEWVSPSAEASAEQRAKTMSSWVTAKCTRCGKVRGVNAMAPSRRNDWGDPHADATWACQECPEHVVMTYEASASLPAIVVGITSHGTVLIGEPVLRGEPNWQHRVTREGITELQQVLELALTDQQHIDRQRHPSELRAELRASLARRPAAVIELQADSRVHAHGIDIRAELMRMHTDGEVIRAGARYQLAGTVRPV